MDSSHAHLGGVDRTASYRMTLLLGGVSLGLKLLIGGFDTISEQPTRGLWLFCRLMNNNFLPTPQQQHCQPGQYSRQTFVNGVMPFQIAP